MVNILKYKQVVIRKRLLWQAHKETKFTSFQQLIDKAQENNDDVTQFLFSVIGNRDTSTRKKLAVVILLSTMYMGIREPIIKIHLKPVNFQLHVYNYSIKT